MLYGVCICVQSSFEKGISAAYQLHIPIFCWHSHIFPMTCYEFSDKRYYFWEVLDKVTRPRCELVLVLFKGFCVRIRSQVMFFLLAKQNFVVITTTAPLLAHGVGDFTFSRRFPWIFRVSKWKKLWSVR